mmetsp:Transcript_22914/g.35246  ORF Transcript_22914/g.35246 Transcript_22914/m.35246 type:complete len:149 (+) Transcript_22914:1655-2101(+)
MEQENLYNNSTRAEEYVTRLCEEMEGDQDALLEAAKFYMRKGEAFAEKAEEYLRDSYSFGMKNSDVALTYACLLVQNGRTKEASVILNSLAIQGYESAKVNMVLSIVYDKEDDKLLSGKYKALALLDTMRYKEMIPEIGSSRQREPGS